MLYVLAFILRLKTLLDFLRRFSGSLAKWASACVRRKRSLEKIGERDKVAAT